MPVPDDVSTIRAKYEYKRSFLWPSTNRWFNSQTCIRSCRILEGLSGQAQACQLIEEIRGWLLDSISTILLEGSRWTRESSTFSQPKPNRSAVRRPLLFYPSPFHFLTTPCFSHPSSLPLSLFLPFSVSLPFYVRLWQYGWTASKRNGQLFEPGIFFLSRRSTIRDPRENRVP